MTALDHPFARIGAALADGLSTPVFAASVDGRLSAANAAFFSWCGVRAGSRDATMLPSIMDDETWAIVRDALAKGNARPIGATTRMRVPEPVVKKSVRCLFAPLTELVIVNAGPPPAGGESAIVVVVQPASLPVSAPSESNRPTYFALAEHLRDVVFMTDENGLVTYVSPAVGEMTGSSVEEILGEALIRFFHPEDREAVREILNDSGEGLGGTREGLRIFHVDGRVLRLSISHTPIRNEDGSIGGLIGVARDTTRLHRLEEDLERTRNVAMLRNLVEGIAGDFNNILVGITGNLSLLRAMAPRGDIAAGPLSRIEQAAERAVRLTQQLSAAVHGGRGEPQTLRVNDTVRRVVSEHHLAEVEDLSIRLDLDDDIQPIYADPAYLRQTLENLLQNAWEAMPGGGEITIRTRSRQVAAGEFADLKPGDYLELAVLDSGIGIDPRHLRRVFEPFYTTKTMRRGLGLTAVHGIVTGLGGRVDIESAFGVGTTVTIHIPLMAVENGADGETSLAGLSILVIEDEAVVREFCAIALGGMGVDVTTAEDGEKGIAAFAASPQAFDVVLLDLVLPDMDGETVFRRLREYRPDAVILLTSGYPEQIREARDRARFPDALGLLAKPFDVAELIALLKRKHA